MARKKSPVKPGKSAPQRVKKNLVVIRGFTEWGEWLERFAASENMPTTVLIDHALREHAKRRGQDDPPARF